MESRSAIWSSIPAGWRLVRLECRIRLRQLGLWPWLALLAWSAATAAQEPRLLRTFDIQIVWQGIWAAAAILLVALCAAGGGGREGEPGMRYGNTGLRISVSTGSCVGLALVVSVAVAHAGLAWFADLLTGSARPFGGVLVAAGGFALAMAPASLVAVLLAPLWGVSHVARIGLVGVVGFSLGAAALWFREPGVTVAFASGLASVGAILIVRFATPDPPTRNSTPHAYRHPR
ncbi:MAG: hypothetical protein KDE27_17930 [Planctomycetes bacterium]|nr:hypothetical protein [Planctomycetota bacterium]